MESIEYSGENHSAKAGKKGEMEMKQAGVILIAFGLLSGCGASAKRIPNDEVSVPMNADDEAALESNADAGTEKVQEKQRRYE